MERQLDNEITQIREHLLRMSGLVERAIDKSIRAMGERDVKLADSVVEEDKLVDELEIQVENTILTALARFQPVAADLRLILACVKITNDLERMGDHAVNIAQKAMRLLKLPQLKPLIDIPYMASIVQDMVKSSLDAFVEKDALKAQQVLKRDDVVDGIEDQINRELLTYMMEGKNISQGLQLASVAKNLERIADLSTNICEEVIFIVEAKTVKHHFHEQAPE